MAPQNPAAAPSVEAAASAASTGLSNTAPAGAETVAPGAMAPQNAAVEPSVTVTASAAIGTELSITATSGAMAPQNPVAALSVAAAVSATIAGPAGTAAVPWTTTSGEAA